jgi:hypothetical protein
MFGAGAAMFAASVASGVAHAPLVVSVIFGVLMVLCGVAGFILIRVGAVKSRAETKQIVAQAAARTGRAKRD